MFGWLSFASARASRVKRSAKLGSRLAWGGRIFSATSRSSLGLARLVDGAHAALTDQFEDFEVWEQFGQFSGRRRHEIPGAALCGRAGRRMVRGGRRGAFQADPQQTLRTQSGGSIGGNSGPTFLTAATFGHGNGPRGLDVCSFLKQPGGFVTAFSKILPSGADRHEERANLIVHLARVGHRLRHLIPQQFAIAPGAADRPPAGPPLPTSPVLPPRLHRRDRRGRR